MGHGRDADTLYLHIVEGAMKSGFHRSRQMRGRKILVLDPTLSGPISLVVSTDTIREHGGEELVSFSFNYGALSPPESFRNICYFVRPTQDNIQKLVHHVLEAEKQGHTREFGVFFWPR